MNRSKPVAIFAMTFVGFFCGAATYALGCQRLALGIGLLSACIFAVVGGYVSQKRTMAPVQRRDFWIGLSILVAILAPVVGLVARCSGIELPPHGSKDKGTVTVQCHDPF